MKRIALCLLLLYGAVAFGQTKTVVFDREYGPLEHAKAFDFNHEFAGVSNERGELELQKTGYPYEIKCVGYESQIVKGFADTVFLQSKFQQLEEVNAKPVDLMELYNAILEKSSATIDHNASVRYGTFFESILLIDTKYHDTIRMEAVCDLAIEKDAFRKKPEYVLYCANGKAGYEITGSGRGPFANTEDTVTYARLLAAIPSFDKYLDYDLVKTKKYELKFEDKEITRDLGAPRNRLHFAHADKRSALVDVEYRDSLLYFWRNKELHEKEYDGSGIFVNYKVNKQMIEFSEDSSYEFRSIIGSGLIQIGLTGVLYEIYMVKGFIGDESRKFEKAEPVKKVEDYIDTLPLGRHMPPFYNFELEK